MKIKLNLYNLFVSFLFSTIFFLIISLFFSAQKILIVFLISIIFFFTKVKYQKVILLNLVVLIFVFKIAMYPFQKKINQINPSITTIYEKHFLYGIKNLNFVVDWYNGDLSSLDENFKIKYFRAENPKKIEIITDNFGFRNKIKPNNAKNILIGDSFLNLDNITQEQILNYVLNNKYNLKTYNAGLAATDISHYFETIKFFKDEMKLHNKKYIMFIFQGNDFLNYKLNGNNNYHKYVKDSIIHTYFRFKVFLNFYSTLKYLKHLSRSTKKGSTETQKVFEYNLNGQDVLFKFDYIYNGTFSGNNITPLTGIFDEYNKYLPDVIIFIPTKYEVYCDFIENNTCKNTEHFSILKNDPVLNLNSVKILDATGFFRNKAKSLMQIKNELLYEVDDTHLSETGVSALAEFVSNHIKR